MPGPGGRLEADAGIDGEVDMEKMTVEQLMAKLNCSDGGLTAAEAQVADL